MKFQLNRIGTQLMFQLIFLLVMRRMIQDKIPALQPCSLDIINCQWSLMRRHKFENQFLKRFWRGATTKIWKACQQQHRQPNFVAGDDDEDLCPEKKAKKKKQGGVSSKPWGSLVFQYSTKSRRGKDGSPWRWSYQWKPSRGWSISEYLQFAF